MASASSLLGLVSQLQSLESSFAAILMEAAMKLANLTDANIFFLVETPQGRKFSGKRHLCDLYIGGELAPVGDDVEYLVDPSISAIQERVVSGAEGGGAAGGGGDFLDESLLEAESFDAGDMFFEPDFLNDSSFHEELPGTGKLRKILPVPGGKSTGKRFRRSNNAASSSRKSKRPVISTSNGPSSPSKRFKSNCKMEPFYDDQLKDNDATSLEANQVTNGPEAATHNGNRAGASAGPTNGDMFETGGEYDLASIAHARMPHTKLTAFSSIDNPSVYVKGSVENRLAVSVCYDFGKSLAELRPPNLTDDEGKAFLKANFDRWILQYDNLRSFLDVMIPNGNPEKGVQFSFMGMLRKAARSGYGCSKKNWGRGRASLAIENAVESGRSVMTNDHAAESSGSGLAIESFSDADVIAFTEG